MKKIVYFALILVFLCQCTPNDKLITKDRVGCLKLGSSEFDVLSKLSMYNVNELKSIGIPNLYKYYNVYDNKKLIHTLMFSQDKLWAIQVHDNTFYTSKRVMIGNTYQAILNKGHLILALRENDKTLRSQIEEDNVYFYFQKKITKYGKIGRQAMLKSITIGSSFDVYEMLEKENEKKENLSTFNKDTFYNEKFNLELLIPNGWTNKTEESNTPSVTELLFITNKNEESSLLLIAEKLSNSKFSNGFDYITKTGKYTSSLSNISDNPITIAEQEFYTGVLDVDINGRIQKQLYYCTVNKQYAIIITAKFFDDKNLEKIKELILMIKPHNRAS